MFDLHAFLPSKVRQKGYEIMDMKKCAATPCSMYLLKYNTLFYTNIFLEKKNISTNALNMSGKI